MNCATFQCFKVSSAHSHCPGNGYAININKWHKLRNQVWWVVSNHVRAGLNVTLQDASLVFVVKTKPAILHVSAVIASVVNSVCVWAHVAFPLR